MHPIIENGENWMTVVLKLCRDSHEFELYRVICYEIWNERNKAWQENAIRSPYHVGWVAATNLLAYKDANEMKVQENMLETTRPNGRNQQQILQR